MGKQAPLDGMYGEYAPPLKYTSLDVRRCLLAVHADVQSLQRESLLLLGMSNGDGFTRPRRRHV